MSSAPYAVLAQEPADSGQLEEITVSARFRDESLQQTPLAVTAITGESLELRNVTNVVDIGKYSPMSRSIRWARASDRRWSQAFVASV